MAEVFGAAAGAIGLASFAVQLAEAVAKLKTFCERVNGAPTELQECLEESEITGSIIEGISAEAPQQSGINGPLLRQSLTLCRNAVERIAAVANQLSRMLLKLARAKADLHTAYNIYTTAQLKDEIVSHRQHFADLQIGQVQIVQHMATLAVVPNGAGKRKVASEAREVAESVATSKPRESEKLASKTTQYHIRLPTWLYSQSWDISVTRAVSGWTVSLRSYKLIPGDHAVWTACARGDLVAIKQMIEHKTVCLYDRNLLGESLFTFVTGYGQTSVARFLIGNGCRAALSGEPTDNPWLRLNLTHTDGYLKVPEQTRAHMQYLLDECDYDSNGGLVRILTKSPSQWTDKERIELLYKHTPQSISPTYFHHVLGSRHMEASWINVGISGGVSLLHTIAKKWAYSHSQRSIWCALVKEAVQAGANLHARIEGHSSAFTTPLASFLFVESFLHADRSQVRTKVFLHNWTDALDKAGVDLKQYGYVESSYVHSWLGAPWRQNHLTNVLGLKFGRRPADWGLWYRHAGDEYAGMFWHVIDHPEQAIPGAWHRDED